MSWQALGAGAVLGALHWLIFCKSLQKLFSKQVFAQKRGTLIKFACLRTLITVGLAVCAIRYLNLAAVEFAVGFVLAFNIGRFYMLKNGRRTLEER